MSLITETGIASADSESLCDVSTADTYFSRMGNTTWNALFTSQKEAALRKATNYMEQVYKARWQGLRVNSVQALDWPRMGVTANGYSVLSTIVPVPIQRACAELALRSLSLELLPDIGQQKISAKVGDIEVTYDKASPQQKQYPAIDALLAPFFQNSAFTHRLER